VASANWTRTGNSVTNNADIAFPTVTSTAYTVVGWAILDASSSGNQLYWGDTTSTLMSVGDTPRFSTGFLTVTED